MSKDLFIGCPIWASKDWVGNFFPKGTKSSGFLREYSKRLTTVEGNTTFYAVPSPDTVKRWAAETPDHFRFAPKLPKTISHTGPLGPNIQQAHGFVDLMRGLGSRLGPIFLQLPPRYSPRQIGDLQAFIEAWPADVRLAVEVRHEDWFEPQPNQALNELLREHDAARVHIDSRPIRSMADEEIGDESVYVSLKRARERKPHLPILPDRMASFTFVRYIGHPNLESNAALLDEWAARMAGWLQEGADVFAFCHCPDDVVAPPLCRELHRRIAALAPVPHLPWDEQPEELEGQQAQLL